MLKKIKKYQIELTDFKKKDINETYLSWLNNKKLMQYSDQRFKKYDYFEALKYLNLIKNKKSIFKKILFKQKRKFIGTITAHIDYKSRIADIGILIGDKNFRQKGLGEEAWIRMIRYLIRFKKIQKVTAGTMIKNKPMLNIFISSGMLYGRKNKKLKTINYFVTRNLI
tara:strand:+ start:337 stop:840 length:504 start_codon:yes stop_codon:yes gene_type:complete